MNNIYGAFTIRHISDYPNGSGWHYAMNANREILPRMFYHSMDTGWTTDDFNLEYWLDKQEPQTDELLDHIGEYCIRFVSWVESHRWEYDHREQRTHTIKELFAEFKKYNQPPVLCLPISELKDLLCDVSQLIVGWNATESEWSKWDEDVKEKVFQLQKKIDGCDSLKFD